MSENNTVCTFTHDTLTINGTTYPAEYSVTPSGNVFAFVNVTMDGQDHKMRIKITADDPRHAAALVAAQAKPDDEPGDGYTVADAYRIATSAGNVIADVRVIEKDTSPDLAATTATKLEQEQEAPARNPKQARGPVPEKTFVGLDIKGKGWQICFDGGYDRTRVIFKRPPCSAARESLKKYGFYWSPVMQSWNKKLTHKAFRAAQELAFDLRKICG